MQKVSKDMKIGVRTLHTWLMSLIPDFCFGLFLFFSGHTPVKSPYLCSVLQGKRAPFHRPVAANYPASPLAARRLRSSYVVARVVLRAQAIGRACESRFCLSCFASRSCLLLRR